MHRYVYRTRKAISEKVEALNCTIPTCPEGVDQTQAQTEKASFVRELVDARKARVVPQ